MLISAVRRRLATVTITVLATVTSSLLFGGPAHAANQVTPGSFTGFAFDIARTPSQHEMNTWLTTSPYWGVAVYIGGSERLSDQPNLNATWVSRQSRRGWKILPIWVGPQASCAPYEHTIDATRADSYVAARKQGRRQAYLAVQAAKTLGFPTRSTIWYDLEDFDLQKSDDCRRSALSFLSAWTKRLHELNYTSGVYSNIAAGIHALDYADTVSPSAYAEPDQIWYAWHNNRADTALATKWVRSGSWAPHKRIHQYTLDTTATYGGLSLKIDKNFMDVGRGSVAPEPSPSCGVRIDFADYRTLIRGSTGSQVKAAQCLLRQRHFYNGPISGRYDRPTLLATRALQRSRDLTVSGTMTPSSWTALLSSGPSPVLKRGSASNSVRRLQRALNAGAADLNVSGVFAGATTSAVKRYQSKHRLPATGVVSDAVWNLLRAGKR